MDKDGDLHIDHIVPVSLGGPNDDFNLQLTHASCNLSKNDSLLVPVPVHDPSTTRGS